MNYDYSNAEDFIKDTSDEDICRAWKNILKSWENELLITEDSLMLHLKEWYQDCIYFEFSKRGLKL
ncbi:hypothetical protein CMI47_15455 [Candidatus Pacearchaeota archaeon]|jgi:hypothetical protein|nr:hypothetical protein [Candidatus Pacearchaeota archaeon]|tara:strand:- start:233 stop:430 length:198 start_codon:yes stop_codon:yes gene_type:complete